MKTQKVRADRALALFMFIFLLAAPLHAETLDGRLSEIDPVSQILTIVRNNSATGNIETLKLAVARNARLEGFTSLEQLAPGDLLRIEASKMEVAASWEANEIQKTGSHR